MHVNTNIFNTVFGIVLYSQKNQMNPSSMLSSQCNKKKGKILYQSEVYLEGKKPSVRAVLFENCIMINHMYIEYSFDLKFTVKDSEIILQKDDQTCSVKLPRQDEKKWRDVLKLYLNQRGFHEAFKAIKKIGKGNFASVYLVEKVENKVRYAVKAFSKQNAYAEENGKQCLIKQIQIMRNLDHRNLMKLQQVFESENSLYIVFQLLEGGQLHDKIKEKKTFTPLEAQQMTQGLLEGLAVMHSKKIMHRDLKPQNILIRHKNSLECVIADFGLSEFSQADEYLFVRCGTPGFVAPQVINIKDMKSKYSPVCDIFSMGLIFHIFLLGFSPFRKKSYNEVLAENRACKFDFEGEQYKKLSSQALDLVKKMLKVNPQERITAQQALEHPYFKNNCQLQDFSPKLSKNKSSVTTICESPQDTLRVQKVKLDKDSCLQFIMNKQNVVNGKTDTVKDNGQTRVSVFGNAMTPGRVSKASKFSRMQ